MNAPRARAAALALVLLAAAGCKSAPKVGYQPDASATKQLLDTDRAFAALSEREGPAAAYKRFAAPDIRSLGSVGDPVSGLDAVLKGLTANPTLTITWDPHQAEVARSGDLGWTWGTYVSRGIRPGNTPLLTTGKYLSVWHRQPDGTWRLAHEIGNEAQRP